MSEKVKLTPAERGFLTDLHLHGDLWGWPAPSSTRAMIRRLVDRGLVEYTPATAKRVSRFSITPAGRGALEQDDG